MSPSNRFDWGKVLEGNQEPALWFRNRILVSHGSVKTYLRSYSMQVFWLVLALWSGGETSKYYGMYLWFLQLQRWIKFLLYQYVLASVLPSSIWYTYALLQDACTSWFDSLVEVAIPDRQVKFLVHNCPC